VDGIQDMPPEAQGGNGEKKSPGLGIKILFKGIRSEDHLWRNK